jgi:hypothetical protein
MSDIMTFLRDAVAKMNGTPTEAEYEAKDALNKHLENKQRYREFQNEHLPNALAQFDPSTLPKDFLVDPNAGPPSPDYTNLRLPIYRRAGNPKNAGPTGLETLPAKDYHYYLKYITNQHDPARAEYLYDHPPRLSLEGAYALPRAMAAAKNLGVPQVDPALLAGLYLKEGRDDSGANSHDYTNPKSNALVADLVDKYNVDSKTASFLALLKEKQDTADRLNIPFGRAWNGTGTNAFGQTGAQYAADLQDQIKAAQQPQNKNLMDMINLGIQHGTQYPYVDPRAQQAYQEALPQNSGIAALLR